MIPRYSPADMAALFSDEARFAMWLEVELLATEAQAALGVVPAEDAATVPGQGARRSTTSSWPTCSSARR